RSDPWRERVTISISTSISVQCASMTTAAELLLALAENDGPALLFEDSAWTFRQLIDKAWQRAALFESLGDRERPPHVGVLLDNVPEYLFWLAAAAVSGIVVVG